MPDQRSHAPHVLPRESNSGCANVFARGPPVTHIGVTAVYGNCMHQLADVTIATGVVGALPEILFGLVDAVQAVVRAGVFISGGEVAGVFLIGTMAHGRI